MSLKSNEFRFASSNGTDTITARIWYDDAVPVRCILQLLHGMNDCMERYEDMARYFVPRGFVVCGHDMTGHGKSAGEHGYGFLGEGDNVHSLTRDARALNTRIRTRFPGLPVVLAGQGLGSLLGQRYITKYGGELAGAVFCGTAGPRAPYVSPLLCRLIMTLHGSDERSPLLNRRLVAALGRQQSANAVISYTADAIYTVGMLHKEVSGFDWASDVSQDLPMLFLSGGKDPIGSFGKGVSQICRRLQKTKHNVTLRLYEDEAHDILHSKNCAAVFDDMLQWVNGALQISRTLQEAEVY